jgi:hypothetical protein
MAAGSSSSVPGAASSTTATTQSDLGGPEEAAAAPTIAEPAAAERRPAPTAAPPATAPPRPPPAAQLKRVGRISVDLSRKLYASANSTVYMGAIGSKPAVVKVTRSEGAESAGENREEAIMQDLSASGPLFDA